MNDFMYHVTAAMAALMSTDRGVRKSFDYHNAQALKCWEVMSEEDRTRTWKCEGWHVVDGMVLPD